MENPSNGLTDVDKPETIKSPKVRPPALSKPSASVTDLRKEPAKKLFLNGCMKSSSLDVAGKQEYVRMINKKHVDNHIQSNDIGKFIVLISHFILMFQKLQRSRLE